MKRSLYFNGEIVTMEASLYAEAVIVEDGIIKMVGKRDDLLKHIDTQTNIVNLKGAALLPGFIDSHSHISAYAQTLGVVQLDRCKSFSEIVRCLQDFQKENKPAYGEWILGFGYDHTILREFRHPDKTVLDAALPGYRILISHISGQIGVMSSPGLTELGITAYTPDPQGGKIVRIPGIGEPNGILQGNAFINSSAQIPTPTEEQMLNQLEDAQNVYFRYGVTTVQEGCTHDDDWAYLRAFSDSGRLKADVVCYVDTKDSKHIAQENISRVQHYKRHLKIGGYKLFLDGSAQNRTAWMTQSYKGREMGYRGLQIYSDEEAENLLYETMSDHLQVLIHCNGDAAAEQLISCCERITESTDLGMRPVMIHAQFVRKDQLERMARLGMLASFFIAHTYFWGDLHIQNFGQDRAERISPALSARDSGVIYTFHQDTPLLMPNMLTTIWCAVNRITRAGVILGRDERVSTLEALRGVTVNAAYQYFEEDTKGSIKEGKIADFVILDYNPMRVLPADLRKIKVLKTIKDDVVVYEQNI